MRYYQVRKEYDNFRKFDSKIRQYIGIYIGGELYTVNEVIKYKLNLKYLDPVYVKKSDVYFMFGGRFADKNDIHSANEQWIKAEE